MVNNIEKVRKLNLCISCGICQGVCPRDCIELNKRGIPVIDRNCTNCGTCLKYCPGLAANIEAIENLNTYMRGKIEKTYVGRTKNNRILRNAVSGGIVTDMILQLLKCKMYDYAIGVGTTYFQKASEMRVYTINEFTEELQKSVYTMASYANVIRFVMDNPETKIIIVGIGCVISAVKKFLMARGKIDKYLFVGLFCDCTLDKNIEYYFRRYANGLSQKIEGMEYRDKLRYGWPGNIKLISDKGNVLIPREERYRVVPYFKRERCIYCLDHLNVNSDIAFGDNYTQQHSDILGSNSIIVRTKKGMQIIDKLKTQVCLYEIDENEIIKSQNLKSKRIQYIYSLILKERTGVDINQNVNETISYSKNNEQNMKEQIRNTYIGKWYNKWPFLFELYLLKNGKTELQNRFLAKKELRKLRENK